MGLAIVETPYVLSIHNDTLVRHPHWLTFLVGKIEADTNIAGIGSWKLEQKPAYKRVLKKIEYAIQFLYYRLTNKTDHALVGLDGNHYYLRSHCALYRTELVKKYGLRFGMSDEVAGKAMHRGVVENGHGMIFLSSEELVKYILHINHATSTLNPNIKSRGQKKGERCIAEAMKCVNAESVLADDALDIGE